MTAGPAKDFRTALRADPSLFLQRIDFLRRLCLLVEFTPSDYRNASFLDGRTLTSQSRGHWMSFEEIAAATAQWTPRCPLHFIFHSGHAGSTLISRLLESAGGVLAIREPLPLRTLAEASDTLNSLESLVALEEFEAMATRQIKLWRRPYAGTRTVVVKATSSCVRLAPVLLRLAGDSSAICINVGIETYLATLLAGENSILDLKGHGAERMRRLSRYAAPSTPLHSMDVGELAAMAWVTETMTQAWLKRDFGERVLAIDFDAFLENITAGLTEICSQLGIPASASFLEAAGSSETMRRYSKAPEAAYSPEVRRARLEGARKTHADQVSKGRRWLESLLRDSPQLAALLPDG